MQHPAAHGNQARLSRHAKRHVTGGNQKCTRLRFIRIGDQLPLPLLVLPERWSPCNPVTSSHVRWPENSWLASPNAQLEPAVYRVG